MDWQSASVILDAPKICQTRVIQFIIIIQCKVEGEWAQVVLVVFLGTTSLVYDGWNDKIGEYQLDYNHKVILFITYRLA